MIWHQKIMPGRGFVLALAALVMMGLNGCAATSTIFFPKDRATKAADNVIDEIFGGPVPTPLPTPAAKPGQPKR